MSNDSSDGPVFESEHQLTGWFMVSMVCFGEWAALADALVVF